MILDDWAEHSECVTPILSQPPYAHFKPHPNKHKYKAVGFPRMSEISDFSIKLLQKDNLVNQIPVWYDLYQSEDWL